MDLKLTPLNNLHRERGARMVPFAGWDMPVQYSSILEEHSRVRESVGLFDVSHMGQFTVKGAGAAVFLDSVCVGMLSNMQAGEAKYSILCKEDGGTVDDLIIYRLDADDFLLIVNASNIDKDFAWLEKHLGDFSVSFGDVSNAWALIAIQGPQAIAWLEKAGLDFPETRFTHTEADWSGTTIRVCRTGYTGEDGVECLVRADESAAFAKTLEAIFGKDAWCGLGARDSLRLEAGLPLYGHELTEELGPIEARMKWTVDFEKADFVGKMALEARIQEPDRRVVRLFAMRDRRIARPGTEVVDSDGRLLGTVLSGSMSPALQRGIGSALLPFKFKGDAFVSIRGKQLPIDIKKSLI